MDIIANTLGTVIIALGNYIVELARENLSICEEYPAFAGTILCFAAVAAVQYLWTSEIKPVLGEVCSRRRAHRAEKPKAPGIE